MRNAVTLSARAPAYANNTFRSLRPRETAAPRISGKLRSALPFATPSLPSPAAAIREHNGAPRTHHARSGAVIRAPTRHTNATHRDRMSKTVTAPMLRPHPDHTLALLCHAYPVADWMPQ